MKLLIVLTLVACCCAGLLDVVEASPEAARLKRAVMRSQCPEGATLEECLVYAAKESKSMDVCHRFDVQGSGIEWQTCGVVQCEGGLTLKGEDLSKPYPECCSTCELIE